MPDKYEEACYDTKAIQRKRGITEPGDLMMLSLFHLLNGCSLVEISEVAKLTKLGEVSDVAFMKRFEKCNNWFKWIISELLTDGAIRYQKPEWLESYRVIAVDASDVTEKGRSGRQYHLHFALDLFKMESLQYKITSQDVGESLKNFVISERDLVVGDRAYGTLKGIEHCTENRGSFILRLRKNCFKMYTDDNEVVDLLKHLRSLKDEETLDLNVYAIGENKQRLGLRVCAMRKSEEAIDAAKKKMRRKASKQQRTLSDETSEFNEYIIQVTNLPDTIISDKVLEIYRLRWQVEIHFKRLKSILDFGELPKRRHESVMAWLNGKMMVALLIEKLIGREDFSPTGECSAESMA
jgi:transposase